MNWLKNASPITVAAWLSIIVLVGIAGCVHGREYREEHCQNKVCK